MASTDVAFSGSVPKIYDRYLGPLLFEPYAEDLAARLEALAPGAVLETAAGTGLVSRAIVRRLPKARLTATDLNQAMLDVAAERLDRDTVELRVADAQALPFEDGAFDAVVCQFGMMFLPDRPAGYQEAARVLKPGAAFVFNVWDSLEENPVGRVVAEAVAALFPDDPPSFLRRAPWGYHDKGRIEQDARGGGFEDVRVETVRKRSRAPTPAAAAIGLCQGSPLRSEIEARGDLQAATDAATAALVEAFGAGPLDQPMSAHVVTAMRGG
jgi:SAM-dependent methyltransferase